MWQRLRNDFRLAILTLFGVCAVLSITPFAVYRLVDGNLVTAMADAAIVALITGGVLYAWRSGDVRRPAAFLALTNTAGCVAVIYLHPLGLFWLYPALLGNYFLIPRGWAVLLAALSFSVVAFNGHVFASSLHMLTYLASGTLVNLLAYIFASRTEAQHRQLEMLASHDSLTGAQNRRAMERELDLAVAAYRRDGRTTGLAIVDLDHFKRINDSAGHEAGDRVLQSFADLIRENTRSTDRFFRYGGEEFVLLLPGADASALSRIGEKLRACIAAGLHHDSKPVTISIGAAVLRPDENWQDWMSRADAALYRAKQAGRDRVEVDAGQTPLRTFDDARAPRTLQRSR